MQSSEDLPLHEAQFASDWHVTLQLIEVCGWVLNVTMVFSYTGQELFIFCKFGLVFMVVKNLIGLITIHIIMSDGVFIFRMTFIDIMLEVLADDY